MSGDIYLSLPSGMQRGHSAPKGEEYESAKIAEYLQSQVSADVAKHTGSQQLSLPDKRAGFAANLKKSGTRVDEYLSPQQDPTSYLMTTQGEESKAKTTVKLPKKNYITVLRKKSKPKKKESPPSISPFPGKPPRKSNLIMLSGFAAEPTGEPQEMKYTNVKVQDVNSYADLTDEEARVVSNVPGLGPPPKTVLARAVAKKLPRELADLRLKKAYIGMKQKPDSLLKTKSQGTR